jgi:hypothetical protein
MGCTFCATGMMGFTANLTCGEILEQVCHLPFAWFGFACHAPPHECLAQVYHASKYHEIRNVVFMGRDRKAPHRPKMLVSLGCSCNACLNARTHTRTQPARTHQKAWGNPWIITRQCSVRFGVDGEAGAPALASRAILPCLRLSCYVALPWPVVLYCPAFACRAILPCLRLSCYIALPWPVVLYCPALACRAILPCLRLSCDISHVCFPPRTHS